jgi:hypothetical protein
MSTAILVILLLSFWAVVYCGTKFELSSENWENKPILKEVVPMGVKGVAAFLKKSYPKEVSQENPKLKKVLKIENEKADQVAGTNFWLELLLVAGSQVFKCSRVVVRLPFPSDCNQKGSLCLEYLSDSGAYEHQCSLA